MVPPIAMSEDEKSVTPRPPPRRVRRRQSESESSALEVAEVSEVVGSPEEVDDGELSEVTVSSTVQEIERDQLNEVMVDLMPSDIEDSESGMGSELEAVGSIAQRYTTVPMRDLPEEEELDEMGHDSV